MTPATAHLASLIIAALTDTLALSEVELVAAEVTNEAG
jgi:hypothetical protein